MTYFEIFSNVSSRWENIFPIIKDPLILEDLKKVEQMLVQCQHSMNVDNLILLVP